ncbi:MAG: amidase family protein [bacterium]
MTGADILYSSTTALAASIKARDVSAGEVLDAHLAQIDTHNGALNAVVTMDVERARARAREADDALARGELWGPLHGVPFTLKDAHATAGMRTTTGFPPFDHVPLHDGTVAARLKAAGGILVGKTNVAMLLSDYQSVNPVFGRTNNPWNVGRTPGGSSGGAAAAIAAGMTSFDVGTDMAGSVRVPAHFCGVFGLKPTEHRISLDGVVPDPHNTPRPVRIVSCVGPMARTIEDLDLLHRILAGPDGHDMDVPPVPIGGARGVEIKNLRIAYAPMIPGIPVATDIRAAIEALAEQLARRGAAITEAPLPEIEVEKDLQSLGALIGMMTSAFQPNGKKPATLAQYLEALVRRDRSIAAWDQFFEEWDVLLMPPSMTTAFPHCEPGTQLQVDGNGVDYMAVGAHASLFNYSGHPAVTMPYRLDRDGLPIGVQLVGKRWDEGRLLGIAKVVSRDTGEFRKPPGY